MARNIKFGPTARILFPIKGCKKIQHLGWVRLNSPFSSFPFFFFFFFVWEQIKTNLINTHQCRHQSNDKCVTHGVKVMWVGTWKVCMKVKFVTKYYFELFIFDSTNCVVIFHLLLLLLLLLFFSKLRIDEACQLNKNIYMK
jgi:hypothetical protein